MHAPDDSAEVDCRVPEEDCRDDREGTLERSFKRHRKVGVELVLHPSPVRPREAPSLRAGKEVRPFDKLRAVSPPNGSG
jgi:hypothetical protein